MEIRDEIKPPRAVLDFLPVLFGCESVYVECHHDLKQHTLQAVYIDLFRQQDMPSSTPHIVTHYAFDESELRHMTPQKIAAEARYRMLQSLADAARLVSNAIQPPHQIWDKMLKAEKENDV